MEILIFIGVIVVIYFIAFSTRSDKTVYHSPQQYQANTKVNYTSIDKLRPLINNLMSLDTTLKIVDGDESTAVIENPSRINRFFIMATDHKNMVTWTHKDGADTIELNWGYGNRVSNHEYFSKIKNDLEPHKNKFNNFK